MRPISPGTAQRKGKSGQPPPAKPKQHKTEARVQREEKQTKAESMHLQRTYIALS